MYELNPYVFMHLTRQDVIKRQSVVLVAEKELPNYINSYNQIWEQIASLTLMKMKLKTNKWDYNFQVYVQHSRVDDIKVEYFYGTFNKRLNWLIKSPALIIIFNAKVGQTHS